MHCGWQFSVFAPPSAGDRPVSRLMVAVSPITSSRDLNRTRSYKSLFENGLAVIRSPRIESHLPIIMSLFKKETRRRSRAPRMLRLKASDLAMPVF
ncbi:hypothetical protein K1719_022129 [Acacia pycnantha]|nr:hypothetical protein K1719_022129 [Acacia pycnantha]